MNISKFSAVLLIGGLSLNQQTLGNGFFGPSDGLTNEGVAGAGVAWDTTDISAANINPAIAPRLPNEVAFAMGAIFSDQKLDTSHSTLNNILTQFGGPALPPHTKSLKNKKWFTPIGIGGVNYRLKDKPFSLSFSWFGGGGLTKYKSSPISPVLQPTKRFENVAVLMPVTLGWRPTCDQSYGVSLVLGYANLRTNLALPSNPFQATKGANKRASAVGLGARIGGVWDLSKLLSVGLSVGSPVWFTKFHEYSDVLKHSVNIPWRITGGTAWHVLPSTDILLDVAGLFWNLEKATGNSVARGGLGWRNTVAVLTGFEHRFCNWKVRAGYQFSTVPVRKHQLLANGLNTIFPFIKHNLAAGVSVNMTETLTLDMNGVYGVKNKFRDPGTGSAGIFERNITMKGQFLAVLAGFIWKY